MQLTRVLQLHTHQTFLGFIDHFRHHTQKQLRKYRANFPVPFECVNMLKIKGSQGVYLASGLSTPGGYKAPKVCNIYSPRREASEIAI